MKYHVVALVLIATMSMGFSFGSKKEKKSTASAQVQQTKTEAKAQVQSASTAAKTEVKKAVEPYASSMGAQKASPKSAAASSAAAAGSEQFPSDLVSQLASGDEKARKARMESLRRLSQALGQMNKTGQTAASVPAASKTTSKKN